MKPAVIMLILAILPGASFAQIKMTTGKKLSVKHITSDFPIAELDNKNWDKASDVSIDRYWSGKPAPYGRHATVRLLWSGIALYVRFEADQHEPLVVSEKPDLANKTNGLWDRDVCEIFIAPDKRQRNKYFEFEIAPTGEWIDLALEIKKGKRHTDWDYRSGMESAGRIGEKKIEMAIKIPFKALGKTPGAGDVWLGNLFRCVGKDPTRGYLAWQPTKTKVPSFHVPDKFGDIVFE